MSTAASGAGAPDHLIEWAVSDDGIFAYGDGDGIFDVLLDGRRIWSLHWRRDSEPTERGRVVRWPAKLVDHLNGTGRVTLVEHLTGTSMYDREVSLGSGAGRISVADTGGRPLSVDKSGRLRHMFAEGDASTTQPLLNAIEVVIEVLTDAGVPAFPSYGTLLGAVRDGTFIGHDSDADVSYFSSLDHPIDLTLESYRLERALRDADIEVQRGSGMAMKVRITEADGTRRGLDIFGSFLFEGTLYVLGVVAAPMRRDQVVPLGTCTLDGRTLPAPADADAWLTATYGRDWRVPDPAFRFDRPRSLTRRFAGWFWGARLKRIEWQERYGAEQNDPLPDPSSFAAWVCDRIPAGAGVIDLGCGRGSDVLAYGRGNHPAVGLDFAPAAYRRAAQEAAQQRLPATFDVLNLNDLRQVLAFGAMVARRDGPPAVTARLLADGLLSQARRDLWRLCQMVQRRGQQTFVEMLDGSAAGSSSYAKDNFLCPLPADLVRAEIAEHGGTVVEQVKVPAGVESPPTARWVISWS